MMHSKFVKLGSLFAAGVLASVGAAAHAAPVNTSATICRNELAGQANDLQASPQGITNVNPAPRAIKCAVPFEPAISLLVISGTVNVNNTVSCTAFVVSPTGGILQSASFTQGNNFVNTTFVQPLAINASNGDLVDVNCTLPGLGASTIFGITAM